MLNGIGSRVGALRAMVEYADSRASLRRGVECAISYVEPAAKLLEFARPAAIMVRGLRHF
jgi:hypothetical protein